MSRRHEPDHAAVVLHPQAFQDLVGLLEYVIDVVEQVFQALVDIQQ